MSAVLNLFTLEEAERQAVLHLVAGGKDVKDALFEVVIRSQEDLVGRFRSELADGLHPEAIKEREAYEASRISEVVVREADSEEKTKLVGQVGVSGVAEVGENAGLMEAVVESGGSVASGSVKSWADEVEEQEALVGSVESSGTEENASGVGVVGGAPVGGAVQQVRCGGMDDLYGVDIEYEKQGIGFMRSYVRTDDVKRLLALLTQWGVSMPKSARPDLALVMYTAATVPEAFIDGRRRLRMLELAGDRAMKALLVAEVKAAGGTAAEVQGRESKSQTAVTLLESAKANGYIELLKVGTGIHRETSTVVSKAVEALLGVIAGWRSSMDVAKVASEFGIVKRPVWAPPSAPRNMVRPGCAGVDRKEKMGPSRAQFEDRRNTGSSSGVRTSGRFGTQERSGALTPGGVVGSGVDPEVLKQFEMFQQFQRLMKS